MRKNELDKINDKMGLIEETLKDEVPKISMPIFSYEAKEERHAKEKRTLMKIIVFLVTVILAIVCGFLLYLNQYDFSVNDTTLTENLLRLNAILANIVDKILKMCYC